MSKKQNSFFIPLIGIAAGIFLLKKKSNNTISGISGILSTTLNKKTNNINVVDKSNSLPNLHLTGVIITAKTITFFANEKEGNLSPLATNVLKWCQENGFEMTSKPVGKSKLNYEYYNGYSHNVVNQWTAYKLK